MNYTEALVAHVLSHRDGDRVPVTARDAAKTFALDSLGGALAGAAVIESSTVLAAAQSWGRGDEATVWGSRETLPAPSAAMVNAFHIHNQEFDCVHEKAVVHPMAVILAALWAYAERASKQGRQINGARFLNALVLAVDVATVVGMTATKPIRFFRPAQCGCLGATMGLAALGAFDETQTKNALGLAYSQLAGTMQAHIEGTPALALQVAFAARSALCAADLAARGFRGPHDVLSGRYGYFALVEDGTASPETPFSELGRIWQVTRVSHKPYPTGRAAQGGISGLVSLMEEHALATNDFASVTVSAPPLIRQLVDRPYLPDMPVNYARLCLPYLLALTMRDGRVSLDAYRAENLRSAELAALAAKVSIVADGNADVNALCPQALSVTTTDGRTLTRELAHVYGSPEDPMSATAQKEKFFSCCRVAPQSLSGERIEVLWQALLNIEHCDDVATIIAQTTH